MMLRNKVVGLGLACSILSGCQSPDSGASHQANARQSTRRPAVTSTQAPPPVRYVLCSNNLPTDGQWKGDPVLQDVNGDGLTDLAALPRLGNGPHIWHGDGRGGWTEAFSGWEQHENSCGGGLVFTDVNGDGKLDLNVADHCRGLFVYLGNGGSDWNPVVKNMYPTDLTTTGVEGETFMGTEDLDVADVNGDGYPDIISSASDESGINVYFGDGTGKNWTRQADGLPKTAWANRVMVVDIDGDADFDVVAAYSDGPRVWHNDGTGKWTDASSGLPSPVIRGLYTGIDVADINEDGRLDIATANWVDGPEVYTQNADGSWQKLPDVFPQLMGGAIGLALGDLDADGHQDLVISGQKNSEPGYVRGVFALKGDGKGHFTYIEGNGLPPTGLATTMGIALGDVNGDGLPDIAAGSGMTVERVPQGPSGPVVPPHLMVWCSQAPARSASLTSGSPRGR